MFVKKFLLTALKVSSSIQALEIKQLISKWKCYKSLTLYDEVDTCIFNLVWYPNVCIYNIFVTLAYFNGYRGYFQLTRASSFPIFDIEAHIKRKSIDLVSVGPIDK